MPKELNIGGRDVRISANEASSEESNTPLLPQRRHAGTATDLSSAASLLTSSLQHLRSSCTLQSLPSGAVRITAELPHSISVTALPVLLRQQFDDYCVYFSKRSGSRFDAHVNVNDGAAAMQQAWQSTAAFGTARSWIGSDRASLPSLWPRIRQYVSSLHGLAALGAARFDPSVTPANEWAEFGSLTFLVPLLELTLENGHLVLACNATWASPSHFRAGNGAVEENGPSSLTAVVDRALAYLHALYSQELDRAAASVPEVDEDTEQTTAFSSQNCSFEYDKSNTTDAADPSPCQQEAGQMESNLEEEFSTEEESCKSSKHSFGKWEQQVHDILSQIQSSALRKAVLARYKRLKLRRARRRNGDTRSSLSLSPRRNKDYDVFTLVHSLQQREQGSYGFVLEAPSGTAFFGCTPEQLLCFNGNRVTSEALAGTRARSSGSADQRLERELSESCKENQEHSLVFKGIMNAFENECVEGSVVSNGCSVRKLRRIQHLYCQVAGTLSDGSQSESKLLDTLHPTAAVCGAPQDAALHAIRNTECFDRGFYSGPVGYISSTGAELAVGIRSGLLQPSDGSTMLYGGVGIVDGADALSEWNETELKISQLETAIQQRPILQKQPNVQMLWATLTIEELWRNGVHHVCVAPGSRSALLALAASRHPRLHVHYCIDERSLGFYALGLAKGNGRGHPTVLITSSGTAVANLLPAAIEANENNIPLFLLTADRPPEMHNCGSNQTIQQPGIFSTCARYTTSVPAPTDSIAARFMLTLVDEAVSKAVSPCPGPVHFNFEFREPLNPSLEEFSYSKALESVNLRWLQTHEPFTTISSKQLLLETSSSIKVPQDVLEILIAAESGIVICTGLPHQEDAMAAAEIGSLLAWPVLSDASASYPLNVQMHHFHWLGSLAIVLGDGSVQDMLSSPDVILQLGVRITSRSTFNFLQRFGSEREQTRWVVVDSSPRRHDPSHLVSHRLELSPSAFARSLKSALSSNEVNSGHCGEWRLPKRSSLLTPFRIAGDAARHSLKATLGVLRPLVTELDVAHQVLSSLSSGSIIFCGNSLPIRDVDMCNVANGVGIGATGFIHESNRGASGIDGLIASASGVAQASGKAVTLLIGDVSFHHDCNSLRLCKENDTAAGKITIVVVRNGGGKVFSQLPLANEIDDAELSEVFETDPQGDISEICEAFGVEHISAWTPDELQEALHRTQFSLSNTVLEVNTREKAGKENSRTTIKRIASTMVGRALSTHIMDGMQQLSKQYIRKIDFQRVSGYGDENHRVLLRVELSGITTSHPGIGWGEAAPHPVFSTETCRDIEVQIGVLQRRLTHSHIPDTMNALGSAFEELLDSCLGQGGANRLVPSLRFALETAILAAISSSLRFDGMQSLLIPQAFGFGRNHVKCNALLTQNSLDEDQAIELGRSAGVVKIKAGSSSDCNPSCEAREICKMSRQLGPDVRIRVDVNRRFSFDQADEFLCKISHLHNVEYVEEPLHVSEISRLPELKQKTHVNIAVDETLVETARSANFDISCTLKNRAVMSVDAFIVKPAAFGSISTCISLFNAAAMAGKRLVVTGAAESSVGLAAVSCIAALADEVMGTHETHGLSILRNTSIADDTIVQGSRRALPYENTNGVFMDLDAISANLNKGPDCNGHVQCDDGSSSSHSVSVHNDYVGTYNLPTKTFSLDQPSRICNHICMLHGMFGCADEWDDVASALAGPSQVVHAITLPGHYHHDEKVTLQNALDMLEDALGKIAHTYGKITLVGYSLGGRLAMQLACTPSLRGHVRAVATIGASPGFSDEVAKQRRAKRDSQLADALSSCSLSDFLEQWYRQDLMASFRAHPAYSTKREATTASSMQAAEAAIALRSLSPGMQQFWPQILQDWKDEDSSSLPAFLFIAGEKDKKFIALAQQLCIVAANAGAKDVQYRSIKGAAHRAHVEAPEELALVVDQTMRKMVY